MQANTKATLEFNPGNYEVVNPQPQSTTRTLPAGTPISAENCWQFGQK